MACNFFRSYIVLHTVVAWGDFPLKRSKMDVGDFFWDGVKGLQRVGIVIFLMHRPVAITTVYFSSN